MTITTTATTRIRLLPLFAALALTACQEGPSAAGGAPNSSNAPTGTVRGEVRYSGQMKGPLKVAVFSSFPPRGGPVAFHEFSAPTFPQAYSVSGLPPGRYFVLAILDSNTADGDKFRPLADPGGAHGSFTSPVAVTVETSAGKADVHVQLEDPSPHSPWAQGGYR